MSEGFWILIRPPKEHFFETLTRVSESFLGLGWTLERLIYGDGTKHLAELQNPTLRDLLRVKAGNAILANGARGIDLDFDFQFPRSIAIGGDETFFVDVAHPLEEMRATFAGMHLPEGSKVKGTLEGTLDVRKPSRGWWIAQLSDRKWQELLSMAPEAVNRELIRMGKSHVILLADSPYKKGDNLSKLVRVIGTRPLWPRRLRKG